MGLLSAHLALGRVLNAAYVRAAIGLPQMGLLSAHLALGRVFNTASEETLGRAFEARPKVMVLGRALNAAIGLTPDGLIPADAMRKTLKLKLGNARLWGPRTL